MTQKTTAYINSILNATGDDVEKNINKFNIIHAFLIFICHSCQLLPIGRSPSSTLDLSSRYNNLHSGITVNNDI